MPSPPRPPGQRRPDQRDARSTAPRTCAGGATPAGSAPISSGITSSQDQGERPGENDIATPPARTTRSTAPPPTRKNSEPAAGDDAGHLGARPGRELQIDGVVDLVQRVGVLSREVRAAAALGDLVEQLLVERGRHLKPSTSTTVPSALPDADRVDPHAGLRGHSATASGSSRRCSRRRRAARSPPSRGTDLEVSARPPSSARVDGERLPRDRVERREDPLPERGSALRRRAGRSRPARRPWSVVGGCTTNPPSLNATTPIRSSRVARRRTRGRPLRRLHPRRLEIVGLHAGRHVEGQDHRAFRRGRSRSASGRAGHDQHHDPDEEQRAGRGGAARRRRPPVVGAKPSRPARPLAGRRRAQRHVARPRAAARRAASTAPWARGRSSAPLLPRCSTKRTSARTRSSSVERS